MAAAIDLSGYHFATENYNDDLQADIVLLRVATSLFSKTKHEEILAVYEGNHSRIYLVREESRRVSEELITRFLSDPIWRRNLLPKILKVSEKLEAVYGDDDPAVETLDTEELLKLYCRQNEVRQELLMAEWPIEEMHTAVNSIEDRLLGLVGGDKQAYSDLLYTPVLSAFSEERKLLQEGADPVQLWKKYRYSEYHGYTNPHVKSLEEYLAEIPDKSYCPDLEAAERYEQVRCRYLEETLDIFRCYANIGAAKSYRRLAELKNFYYLDRMIREMARRFEVPENAIRFMTPEEVLHLAHVQESVRELQQNGTDEPEMGRSSQLLYDPDRCVSMVYYNRSCQEIIYTGEECRKIIASLPLEKKRETISGMIACRGIAKGQAAVIRTAEEIAAFRPGNILVSNEPNPEMFELMRTASAVVTDQGGITCHAAAISRELGIPCITGTKNATRMIHTGDTLFVDAEKGEVTIEGK